LPSQGARHTKPLLGVTQSLALRARLFTFLLFALNLIVFVSLLLIVYFEKGQPMNIQILNAGVFTIAAFILSRILFFYNMKDFINRLLINKQTDEIHKQIKVKEGLIKNLENSLADHLCSL